METNGNNYPIGTENNPNAPWNQSTPRGRKIEVTVSITLSKTIPIIVNDYQEIEEIDDEDGSHFTSIDYSNCDLYTAVKEQCVLPCDAWQYIPPITSGVVIDNLKDWNVDDFEVIKE